MVFDEEKKKEMRKVKLQNLEGETKEEKINSLESEIQWRNFKDFMNTEDYLWCQVCEELIKELQEEA